MRKLFILLIGLCGVVPAASAAAYFDESALGRLFTTPQQRHQIDAFRKGKSTGAMHDQTSPADVKIQGMVIRSDGKSTVWVNGKNTLESSKVGGVDVKLKSLNHKTDRVTVVINKKAVRLKPGQVWSEDNGKVTDSY
jgi:hypothetical protein